MSLEGFCTKLLYYITIYFSNELVDVSKNKQKAGISLIHWNFAKNFSKLIDYKI